MQITPYSAPDFDPYGDRDTPDEEGGPWIAPTASGPLAARLRIPGSKSLTNRELVLAALADGPSLLRAPLRSRDTALMVEALRSLGVAIEEVPGEGGFGPDLLVTPPEELTGSTSIDCGLAGTVMRFVPPLAALALGPVAFDGDEHARRRPMRTSIEALRALGVEVSDEGRGALPFTVHGSGAIRGGELEIDASASSQFVSGLLLAAPRFEEGLRLRHTGERLPSLPHIEMTIHALRARGVEVASPEPGVWSVEPGPIGALDVDIEPDLSNAAPFLAAALVAGGTVSIDGWPASTTQVGDDLRELLPRLGAEVRLEEGTLTVDGGAGVLGGSRPPALDLDLSTGGELAPAIVALQAFAEGPGTVTGIGHLRGHETDRLMALAAVFADVGGQVTELDEGLAITPRAMHGGPWRVFADHRMATAAAIVGLAVEGIAVDDIGATAKTLPEFPELWARMLRGSEPEPAGPAGIDLLGL
ncbi:3-phosphoshikimate 1-carboxyvinyltransferase [Homoserinibacter sp. YIM 151385]|uniref:3-phosphoshikimate 1-carboxyvinyltransferase n=1 Tax=Homoserinibacter sp. YIM 151385 TaxID=2985506 RepID=UPI0022F11F94|nr:3-phosphoshikimate 1-carboxyvinyltransferase [Homoserinibacter sp. YIM 151385]WBU38223.1 3-phosphoshikimate 1-carboxyvinyltransferase [Homoserinibacter sp. YIM 151385]